MKFYSYYLALLGLSGQASAQAVSPLTASPTWLVGMQAVRYPEMAWRPELLYVTNTRPWPAQLVVRRYLKYITLETGLAMYTSPATTYVADYGTRVDTYHPDTRSYLVPIICRFRLAPHSLQGWRLDATAGLLLVKNDYYCSATSFEVKTGKQSAYISGDYGEYFLPLNLGLGATYLLSQHICLTADARVLWNALRGDIIFKPSELLPTGSVGAGYIFGKK
ncbi:MAG: hypothetical protein EOO62_19890 [Hymenobacter sp.]|nr:MAG: hypothetical protein EOO62_19890 [Hymenobacter sp.]